MLNIPESVKALYKRDGVNKNFRARFLNGELPDIKNENIVQETVKFQESVCSQDVFKFGLTEASVIEFETVGVANMYGMTIECSSEIDCSSLSAAEIAEIEAGEWDGEYVPLADSDLGFAFFRVPYGAFRVESCPRDHQAMAHRRVTAYTQNGGLTEKSIFPSEYPTSKLTFSPDVWIAANSLKNEDYEMHRTLTAVPYEGNNRSIRFTPYDANTSGGNSLRFDGVKIAGTNTFLESFLPTDVSPEIESLKRIGVYALKIDFQPNKFDEYAKHFTDAALNHLPSGAYVCHQTGSSSYLQVFQNTKQTISANMGQFAPCYFIVVEYRKSGTTPLPGADVWRRYSKPIFIKSGDVNIVDMTRLDDFAYWNGKNSAYPILDRVLLHVSVPKFWYQFADWEVLTSSGTDSYSVGEDWYSGIPFEEYGEPLVIGTTTYSYMVTRDGVVDVYLHKLTDSSLFRISAENTLDYTKGSTFRPYYTYENALSTEQIINGALELHAQFMKTDRSGEMSFIRLENDSPEAVTPNDYSKMWFDEYDVEPIGTVRYSYTDEAGEEQIVDYKFGDGASVYDMTDNAVLKTMDGASPDVIESLLDTYFVPHLASVNFVPIDLAAKGLPYIEAGDALSVTAQDGTVCNSYALRREMNGVQVLTDQIDSQSGLIIDSEEGGT